MRARLARIRQELAQPDLPRRRKLEIYREIRRLRVRTPDADECEASLYAFVRHAWQVVEPSTPFVDNWHIEAICRHLEYATRTPAYRLLINIPPGCMKSLLVAVFWPCWVWGPYGWPESRWLFASYSRELAVRDSLRCRNLIESAWYQRNWGHCVRLASDANLKSYFVNDRGGWRLATSVGGRGTGDHPDFKIWDDPHKVSEAESDAERANVLNWRDGTLATRGASRGAREIGVMQRLHEDDLSAHVLQEGGWDHICLPMRYELDRMQPTALGWTDPRSEPGELLWPELFPEEEVVRMERSLGSIRAAAQLQQRPTPPGGAIFRREWFQVLKSAPAKGRAVRYWDKAGTAGGGDYTAGVLMVERDGYYYVVDVVRGQWDYVQRERVILQTAALDAQRYGDALTIWLEQEPGSGGKESAEATVRRLAGYTVKAERVTGAKEHRWQPYAAQLEAGNIFLVDGPWVAEFIDEHLIAPRGQHDDQIDAAAGAFAKLALDGRVDLESWLEVI